MGIAHSLHLAHRVAVNGMFTRLVHHARQPDATGRLTAWWSEERCARSIGDIVRPDAYGRWAQGRTEVEWFLELDYGTEALRRLTYKIDAYDRLAKATNIHTPVLIWTTTLRREARLREVLAEALRNLDDPARVPVATTAADLAEPDQHLDATLTRWLPLTPAATGRLSLGQLASLWPPTAKPQPDSSAADSDVGRPTRLHPPQPMPPAGTEPSSARPDHSPARPEGVLPPGHRARWQDPSARTTHGCREGQTSSAWGSRAAQCDAAMDIAMAAEAPPSVPPDWSGAVDRPTGG